MNRLLFTLAAVLLLVPANGEEDMPDSRQLTITTYRVPVDKQEAFLALLKGAEDAMREENLITELPVIRMQSLQEPALLLEVFEWADNEAFARAQENPVILGWWKKFEATWEQGGVALATFPEANQPWPQFRPLE